MKLKYCKIKNNKNIVCFCSFCKGKKMRKDVNHFNQHTDRKGILSEHKQKRQGNGIYRKIIKEVNNK